VKGELVKKKTIVDEALAEVRAVAPESFQAKVKLLHERLLAKSRSLAKARQLAEQREKTPTQQELRKRVIRGLIAAGRSRQEAERDTDTAEKLEREARKVGVR